MSKEIITKMIANMTIVEELKVLRDTGLQSMLDSGLVSGFTVDDMAEFVQLINERIVALGGTV